MNQTSKLLVLVAVASLSLSACTDKESTNAVKSIPAESKVGVKVNGEAVSVAELETKSGHDPSGKKQGLTEDRMKQMVDMELLRQAAVETGLDKDENIRARIAISNRTILAMAYMEKQLGSIGEPTEAEINDFYNNNPVRFAERKIYEVHEFNIQAPPGKAADIRAQLDKSVKAPEFEQWLKGSNIPYNASPLTVSSDRLPEDVLQKLKNVPVGGATVLGGDQQMNVVFVLAAQTQPISLAEAKPAVAATMMEKRKKEILDNTMKQLRDKAKVEYVPPYSEKGLAAEPAKE
jgi:EpsD family peptidyl-prolyl cis-trans isomerase